MIARRTRGVPPRSQIVNLKSTICNCEAPTGAGGSPSARAAVAPHAAGCVGEVAAVVVLGPLQDGLVGLVRCDLEFRPYRWQDVREPAAKPVGQLACEFFLALAGEGDGHGPRAEEEDAEP